MKSEAITVVVYSRIQRERQLNSWEYGSYTSENSRIFLECLVGQISLKFPGRKVGRGDFQKLFQIFLAFYI